MHAQFELAEVDLPQFAPATIEPQITADQYRHRLDTLSRRARAAGFDIFIVYGDREHFANLAFLTGFDPRFEEALLVLNVVPQNEQKPIMLVGMEGYGYANISPLVNEIELVLYQPFGLLGQDRDKSDSLAEILTRAGVVNGAKIGTAGWKHYGAFETETPHTWLEIPSFIVDTLRTLAGGLEQVHNANPILMGSSDGLRAINDAAQLAVFEYASTFTSQALRNVLFGIKPGMTEYDAVELMGLKGMAQSCHLMLSAGQRAFLGMGSPSTRIIRHGDPFTMALGVRGGLNARAGFMVSSEKELPDEIQDYVETLVKPYFTAVCRWYEHIGIGVPGGELFDIIHDVIGHPFFGVTLNPGHLIHLDEWVNSPIYSGSTETLKSGMAIQVDVIPATGTPYFTTNIEDGIALADESLRSELAEKYPEAWGRIQARRAFMAEVLGIELKPEVLPFSNIPAYLPPFLLNPRRVLRKVT